MAYSAGDLQVGFGIEAIPGATSGWNPATTASATRFIEVISESVKASYDRIDSKGLRSQRVLEGKDKFVAGKVDISGDIEFELQTKGLGFLFGHMLGSTVSTATATGGSTAKTHTYSMTAGTTTDGAGLMAQIVRADNTGAQQAFSYTGCKVQSWELMAAQNEVCTAKLTLDGANEKVGTTPATASYSSSSTPLVFTGAAILVGGSAFECKSVSIKGDNKLKTDRYVLGSNIKKEQLNSGVREITGQLGLEFSGVTAYNRVVNADSVAFQATFASVANIETGVKSSVVVTIPDIRFEGETPNGSGQIIEHNLSFKALDDETTTTAPITIAYTTLDTTP
jgi:hypothetical protein